MAHDPRTTANELINRGIAEEQPLTHIEVQKLLYFSHGWMLGIHGRPLHEGLWEAWKLGPVLPHIYYNLNYYRGEPITEPILARPEEFTDAEQGIINSVYAQYRPFGWGMADITDVKGSPWYEVWHSKSRLLIIPNESIQSYFARQYRKYERQHRIPEAANV